MLRYTAVKSVNYCCFKVFYYISLVSNFYCFYYLVSLSAVHLLFSCMHLHFLCGHLSFWGLFFCVCRVSYSCFWADFPYKFSLFISHASFLSLPLPLHLPLFLFLYFLSTSGFIITLFPHVPSLPYIYFFNIFTLHSLLLVGYLKLTPLQGAAGI